MHADSQSQGIVEQRAILRDGTTVVLRPIRPEDKARLLRHFRGLSVESRCRRFLGAGVARLSDTQLRYLTEVDHADHEAWVAVDPDAPDEPLLGVARYVRLGEEPAVAEVAVAVADTHQRRGLGTLLLALISRTAADQGIQTFRSYVFDTNVPIRRVLGDFGAVLKKRDGPVLCLDVAVPRKGDHIPDSPTGRVFRAIASGTQ